MRAPKQETIAAMEAWEAAGKPAPDVQLVATMLMDPMIQTWAKKQVKIHAEEHGGKVGAPPIDWAKILAFLIPLLLSLFGGK